MKSAYKHIIFDLDHTLWDYDANAREMLTELYYTYKLDSHGLFSSEMLVSTFFEINFTLWDDYNHGRISKHYIREQRFKLVFDKLKLPLQYYPANFSKDYIFGCPTKTNIMPYSIEVLEYLQERYTLHILTNGFKDVQSTKLSHSKLRPFFNHVVTSESCGAKKPSLRIFEYTLALIKAEQVECLMIGDNLRSDIEGARNASIDQVYFNPLQKSHSEQITYEIKCLSELKNIL